jgi:hypothetical protein
MMRKIVDFPDPEAPNRQTTSPGATEKEMPLSKGVFS